MTQYRPNLRAKRWLDVLRLFLAFALLPYGLSKLANTQFSHTLAFFDDALKQLNGQSLEHLPGLPVFLLFFSYSRTYQILTGLVEILAASLLLWRKTWPLGALAYLAVMTSVLMVDLCYSVWLNGTVMAALMMAGNLLLIGLERERFLKSVRVLLSEPEKSTQVADTHAKIVPTKLPRWYRLQVSVTALALLVVVMLLVDFLTG